MAIVCSNCDVQPETGAVSGGVCEKCGERLIAVDSGDDLIGTTIDGRFEVLRLLGRGGMGVVYRAKQLSIGREVALKVIDRRIEKEVASVKRFFREAKLASQLSHPNTVPIIDYGQSADGRVFLAMELVNGRTLLDEMNTTGAMPIERLVAIGMQMCDALEAAHDLQIVHRDLKLENVMLLGGKRDHVKVLDFGLARSLGDPSTAMTATGLISGTPRYMPPEVGIEAARPAPSQDMYAIGVMIAELSIGRPLWTATTIEMLFTKKLETEKSIAGVPAVLKPLVRSLLSGDPEKRPTAGQTRVLLRDLEVRGAPSIQIEIDASPGVGPLAGAKHARSTSPVALEPTTDIAIGDKDPFAKLDLVALDELPQPARAVQPAPTLPVAPGPTPSDDDDPRFELPAHEHGGDPKQLEIDPAYVAERSAKLAARSAPAPKVKKSNVGWLVSLLLVAIVGAGGYVLYTKVQKTPETNRLPGGGVSIRVTADLSRDILVDGKPAGTPPVKVQVPKGTKPIQISGDGLVGVSVVPDQDRDVHLKKP